jgi:chemotaxis protein CheC
MKERLNRVELDVLREIGNIGSAHAATSLAELTGQRIAIRVPSACLVPFTDIAAVLGGDEAVVLGIYFRIDGDVGGNLYFFMTEISARQLLLQLNVAENDGELLTPMNESAIKEVGNILTGAYLTALSNMTGLRLMPSVPMAAVDFAGALLNYGLLQSGYEDDATLLIETAFLQGEEVIKAHCFFLPDPEGYTEILNRIGVKVNESGD